MEKQPIAVGRSKARSQLELRIATYPQNEYGQSMLGDVMDLILRGMDKAVEDIQGLTKGIASQPTQEQDIFQEDVYGHCQRYQNYSDLLYQLIYESSRDFSSMAHPEEYQSVSGAFSSPTSPLPETPYERPDSH